MTDPNAERVEHICGLQGYDPMRDAPCPACEPVHIQLPGGDAERIRQLELEVDILRDAFSAVTDRSYSYAEALIKIDEMMPASCTCEDDFKDRRIDDPRCAFHAYGERVRGIIAVASPRIHR